MGYLWISPCIHPTKVPRDYMQRHNIYHPYWLTVQSPPDWRIGAPVMQNNVPILAPPIHLFQVLLHTRARISLPVAADTLHWPSTKCSRSTCFNIQAPTIWLLCPAITRHKQRGCPPIQSYFPRRLGDGPQGREWSKIAWRTFPNKNLAITGRLRVAVCLQAHKWVQHGTTKVYLIKQCIG